MSRRLNPAPHDYIDESVEDYGQGDHLVGDVDKVNDGKDDMATLRTEDLDCPICLNLFKDSK